MLSEILRCFRVHCDNVATLRSQVRSNWSQLCSNISVSVIILRDIYAVYEFGLPREIELCCVFDIMFTFLLCKNLASVGKSGGLENCTVDWLTGGVNEEVRWTLNTHHIQHIPDYLNRLFDGIPHYWQLYSVIHWINLNYFSSISEYFRQSSSDKL